MHKSEPENPLLLTRLIGTLYKQKQFLTLPSYLTQLKSLRSDSLIPEYFEAIMTDDIGKQQQAIELYKKVIQKTPNDPLEIRYRALLLTKFGDKHEALEEMKKYFESEESKDDYEALFEKLILEIGCSKYNDALESCNKLLELAPEDIQLRLHKAMIYKALNFYEKAISELTSLIACVSDPKLKAILFMERGKCRPLHSVADRIADYHECHKLDPSHKADIEILKSFFEANMFTEAEVPA